MVVHHFRRNLGREALDTYHGVSFSGQKAVNDSPDDGSGDGRNSEKP